MNDYSRLSRALLKITWEYLTASNFFPGSSRWLRSKIIRIRMDDEGAANDLIHCKTTDQNCHKRIAFIIYQWRKISGMAWV